MSGPLHDITDTLRELFFENGEDEEIDDLDDDQKLLVADYRAGRISDEEWREHVAHDPRLASVTRLPEDHAPGIEEGERP